MILFKEDWKYYPGAIVDVDTPNKSWVRMAALLKKMGVSNNVFHLSLLDRDLVGVDPHDPNLTDDYKLKILRECKNNPWYMLREVIRVTPSGSARKTHYSLTRLNMAFHWLAFLNISTFVCAGRQSGKSFCAEVHEVIMNDFYGRNLPMVTIVNKPTLKQSSRDKRIAIRRSIPSWISFSNTEGINRDKENGDVIDCKRLGNTIRTMVASDREEGAEQIGRGLTGPIRRVDEGPHCKNIHISLGIAEMGGVSAVGTAIENKTTHYTAITTTPGDITSEEGRYMYNIQNNAMSWVEKLLDSKNHEDLVRTVALNTGGRSGFINITMQFQHLGKDHTWLAKEILRSMATPEDIEKDFLLRWGKGGLLSPLSKEVIARLTDSTIDASKTEIDSYCYVSNWYLPDGETDIDAYINRTPCILSLDPAELAGQDTNGLGIIRLNDMRPLMTAKPCDGNIYTFSVWIYELLTRFPKLNLLIERKSTGVAIIDNLIAMFVRDGKNPLKRIIGRWHSDEALMKKYSWAVNSDNDLLSIEEYSKFKTALGVSTNGTIRKILYQQIFIDLTESYAHNGCSRDLVKQMCELVIRDGRIDHPSRGHDDLVIMWLMVGYVLLNYTNLRYYNIDVAKALRDGWRNSTIKKDGGDDELTTRENKELDEYMMTINLYEFNKIVDIYKNSNDPYESKILELKLTELYKKLTKRSNSGSSLSSTVGDIELIKNDLMEIKGITKRKFLDNLFK